MNNENEIKNENIAPYRATQNLNTRIANPTANINDTMGVNIQSVSTEVTKPKPPEVVREVPFNNANININTNQNTILQNNQGNIQNNTEINNTPNITRTYVSSDNRPKKKKLTLNLGSEFKVALLIIVILLVFIFVLPLITDLVNGS